jgi:hypothetical protein
MRLAERLRIDLFAEPVQIARQQISLSACFAVTSSNGRPPIVVLREVESALQSAREEGPGSIRCLFNGAEIENEVASTHPNRPAIQEDPTRQPQRAELWSTANESSDVS